MMHLIALIRTVRQVSYELKASGEKTWPDIHHSRAVALLLLPWSREWPLRIFAILISATRLAVAGAAVPSLPVGAAVDSMDR